MKYALLICSGLFCASLGYSQQDGLLSSVVLHNEETIVNSNGSQVSDKSLSEAWKYINKGLELNKSEDYNSAMKEFDKAIQTNSDIAQAYDYRAVCYIKLGKYRKAIKDLLDATDIDSKFVDAYNHLGVANYWLENYVDAINCYTRAISLNPSYATPYFNRAIVYLAMEKDQLALKDLNKAKDLNLEGVEPVIQQFFASTK